jgi:aldehyde dehydrogenase (NAD+)
MSRLPVKKTYKLYIGGAFPRSESGRTYEAEGQNVAQSYRIAQEEIFGPVLSVLTFRTPEEAVEKANNTPYGLSAGVWTEKGSRILWMAQQMRAGVVWANTFNRFDPTSPFGGYKESGFGREGGLHGLEPYLRFDE